MTDLANQFEPLRLYLKKVIQVPDEEWLSFKEHLGVVKLRKNDFFFRQGEFFSDVGFLQNGLLVNYYTDSKGVDYVKKFSVPGAAVSCYASQILNLEANYSCRVLEDSVLYTLKYDTLKNFFSRHACWERLGRVTAERLYLEKEFREQHFLVSDAKTRYQLFLESYQNVAEKIPQYLIASYIGITPESLSRLKK